MATRTLLFPAKLNPSTHHALNGFLVAQRHLWNAALGDVVDKVRHKGGSCRRGRRDADRKDPDSFSKRMDVPMTPKTDKLPGTLAVPMDTQVRLAEQKRKLAIARYKLGVRKGAGWVKFPIDLRKSASEDSCNYAGVSK